MSLVAGDYNAVPDLILAMLGRELPEASSDASLSSSDESSDNDESEEVSASEDSDMDQPQDVPFVPAALRRPIQVRRGKRRFCASFGKQNCVPKLA